MHSLIRARISAGSAECLSARRQVPNTSDENSNAVAVILVKVDTSALTDHNFIWTLQCQRNSLLLIGRDYVL